MNHKQKLGYTVLGAVIMLVGLAIGAIVSQPLIAQRNGVFDEIVCKSLEVVDDKGKTQIFLGSVDGGFISLSDRLGKHKAGLYTYQASGVLKLKNDDGEEVVRLDATKNGGTIRTYDKDGKLVVVMEASNTGGVVQTYKGK